MAANTRRLFLIRSFCIVAAIPLFVAMSEAATGPQFTLIMPDTDLALCTCDMTANACDVNCCCDMDCDTSDKLAFTLCIDASKKSDSQMCIQNSLIFAENSPYETTVENKWLCVKIDNYYERNFYSVPTTIVSETEFDMFRATFGDYSYKYQEPVTETHSDYYKSGDPILTVYEGGAVGELGLPAPLATMKCADSNPAAFMHNEGYECQRVIVDLKSECTNNPLINANLYFRGFKLLKTPAALGKFVDYRGSGGTTPSSNTTTTAAITTDALTETESEPLFNSDHAIDIELWSVTCIDENDLQFDCKIDITNNITALVPGPQYDMGGKGSPRCQHVVTDVTYYIKHNGYLGLEKAYVSLTLTEVPEDKLPIMQTFKINFYKTGETDIFRRSGRPGYVVGEPVMAGKLTNIKTDTTTAALQAIELHSDRNKWLTVVSNTISGSCVASPEHRTPVTFGEEMRAGCKISVSLQNMTDSCAFIQDVVLGALRGIDPPTHVATFGDSKVSFVGDWVEIIGLYTQPPQAQRVRDGVCRNLVVGMLTQIVYADIGALQHPQSKIIDVLVTYQTAMVKFQCIGKFCQPGNTDTQTIEVASTVSYIDASSSPVSTAGETPTLPVRLPSDFFYPFT